MPPPSLLYIQMLVMQLQTQDTHGVRQKHLKSQVSQTPLKATQHDSLVYTATLHSGRLLHLVSIYCMLHVQAQHACVSDTVRYLLTMYVLN